MGAWSYIYSLFYEKKTCEFCGKRYYVGWKSGKQPLHIKMNSHETCSYNCSINLLSEYYNSGVNK
jgi:hypothetical protein